MNNELVNEYQEKIENGKKILRERNIGAEYESWIKTTVWQYHHEERK